MSSEDRSFTASPDLGTEQGQDPQLLGLSHPPISPAVHQTTSVLTAPSSQLALPSPRAAMRKLLKSSPFPRVLETGLGQAESNC